MQLEVLIFYSYCYDFALYANVAGVSTVATTATNLSNGNIQTGTINPARLSGTYNISVTNANTADTATNANFATRVMVS